MEFLNSFNKSGFILIEGEKKVGKLTLAIYDAYVENSEKNLIFSTYAKTVGNKRIEAIKNQNIKEINEALDRSRFLFLKEEWPTLKAKFGINFLLEDIYRAIEKEAPKVVIFHRFDLFFEVHEESELKTFIEKILDYKKEMDFKIIFTSLNDEKDITDTIENFSDINLVLTKEETKRSIFVKNSIFPIYPNEYDFILKDKVLITPKDKRASLAKPKKSKILLITQNESIKAKLEYIFKDKFELLYANSISKIIEKILSNPDIIIYHTSEKLDFNLCKTIKEQNSPSKVVYISNEPYVRSDDKMNAVNSGCYELFPSNFNIIDFIAEMEKILDIRFYSPYLKTIKNSHKIKSKEEFCNVLQTLLKDRVYFTFISFVTDKKIDLSKLRDNDFYYVEKNKYYLLLINTIEEFSKSVLKKLFDSKDEYKIEAVYEAPFINNFIKEIC